MLILQTSDFAGYFALARTVYNDSKLQAYIDKYEKLSIYQIFGVELGDLFIEDLPTQNGISTNTLTDTGNTWDASSGSYPTTGGTGTAGAIVKADAFTVSVAGTQDGVDYLVGDQLYALVNTPGQTAANWKKKEKRFTDIYNEFTAQGDGFFTIYYGWWNVWYPNCWYATNPIYHSDGMVSVLTGLVYYNYVSQTQINHTQSGVANKESETGYTTDNFSAHRQGEKRWNDAVDSIAAMQWKMNAQDPDSYTEYQGQIFHAQFSALL